MTLDEWNKLTTEQRVIHYRRFQLCPHAYELPVDDRLTEAWSFDPYAHSMHMEKCERPEKSIDECSCQMCAMKIGIVDYKPKHKVDVEAVRLKLRKRLKL
jgi:hypothetical protein